MNIVQRLVDKPFHSRSFSEKHIVKNLGRPIPALVINQAATSNKKSCSRSFRNYMKNAYGCVVALRKMLSFVSCVSCSVEICAGLRVQRSWTF